MDAYKAEALSRSAAAPPAPAPAAKPSPPAAQPPTTQPDAEIERLKQKLAGLEKDDVESRLAASRAAADEVTVKLAGIDRDLALIRTAGSSRRDRQAVMEELGIKAGSAAAPSANAAEIRAAEEQLRSLQFKKAELGQRLGPEHRDMVALDEQMKLVKERLAKATPAKQPDELDAYRVKLEGERPALAARAASWPHRLPRIKSNSLRPLPFASSWRSGCAPPCEPETGPARQSRAARANRGDGVRGPGRHSRRRRRASQPAAVPFARTRRPDRSVERRGALGLIGPCCRDAQPVPSRPKARVPLSPPMARASSASVQMTSGPKLGIPVFANVPAIRPELQPEKRSAEGLSPLLVAFSQPSGGEAEIFRIARRELPALHNRGHQVVPITSPGPGDGKSLIAANLAISLAQTGKRVILVDCDLKSAKVQELFRLTRLGDSLKSIMASEVDLRMAVRTCEVPNLFLLPAGRGPMDPADLLTRPKFREVIAELKSSYEYVIIDSPSTLAEKEFGVGRGRGRRGARGASGPGRAVALGPGAGPDYRLGRGRSAPLSTRLLRRQPRPCRRQRNSPRQNNRLHCLSSVIPSLAGRRRGRLHGRSVLERLEGRGRPSSAMPVSILNAAQCFESAPAEAQ